MSVISCCAILNFRVQTSTNQRRYIDLYRPTSSVWNFSGRKLEDVTLMGERLNARERCLFNPTICFENDSACWFSFCQAEDMVKVYPPFVNYFEMTKETVTRCDREIPRFHAFLKVNVLIFAASFGFRSL